MKIGNLEVPLRDLISPIVFFGCFACKTNLSDIIFAQLLGKLFVSRAYMHTAGDCGHIFIMNNIGLYYIRFFSFCEGKSANCDAFILSGPPWFQLCRAQIRTSLIASSPKRPYQSHIGTFPCKTFDISSIFLSYERLTHVKHL